MHSLIFRMAMNWHANTDDGAGSKSLNSQQAGQQE
jgi:hypothetical protein